MLGFTELVGIVCHLAIYLFCCRFHAMYTVDGRVQSELLAFGLDFINLYTCQPQIMDNIIKTMRALQELSHDLCEQIAPYTEA